jgi:hypothetical protein
MFGVFLPMPFMVNTTDREPRTPVTDAAVQHLARLTNLRSLDLSHSMLTDAGKAKLKQALPRAYVSCS